MWLHQEYRHDDVGAHVGVLIVDSRSYRLDCFETFALKGLLMVMVMVMVMVMGMVINMYFMIVINITIVVMIMMMECIMSSSQLSPNKGLNIFQEGSNKI